MQQWAILTVRNSGSEADMVNDQQKLHKQLYGNFITRWLKLFSCELWTVLVEPVSGYGLWDGKEVFGKLPRNIAMNGPVAILTRATIRLSKLRHFWKEVPAVSSRLRSSAGFAGSVGIGEIPWIKLATFSIWENTALMKTFAYGPGVHVKAVNKTREQQLFKEEMFVRFRILFHTGTMKGKDPLAGIL